MQGGGARTCIPRRALSQRSAEERGAFIRRPQLIAEVRCACPLARPRVAGPRPLPRPRPGCAVPLARPRFGCACPAIVRRCGRSSCSMLRINTRHRLPLCHCHVFRPRINFAWCSTLPAPADTALRPRFAPPSPRNHPVPSPRRPAAHTLASVLAPPFLLLASMLASQPPPPPTRPASHDEMTYDFFFFVILTKKAQLFSTDTSRSVRPRLRSTMTSRWVFWGTHCRPPDPLLASSAVPKRASVLSNPAAAAAARKTLLSSRNLPFLLLTTHR